MKFFSKIGRSRLAPPNSPVHLAAAGISAGIAAAVPVVIVVAATAAEKDDDENDNPKAAAAPAITVIAPHKEVPPE